MLGIGGISMSGLAVLLVQEGFRVSGYDEQSTAITKDLQSRHINVYHAPKLKQLSSVMMLVVSAAIPANHPDILEAKARKIPILNRGQLLGWLARQYRHVIAVSGSHGKTTTTAMLASIFQTAGLEPTVHIGGILVAHGKNYICGKKDYLITEACEYKDNFLYLHPTFSVVLNVEPDHLDYFKTFKKEKRSFLQFVAQSKACIAPANIDTKCLIFGKDYSAKQVCETVEGITFLCYKKDKQFCQIHLPCYGQYQVHNALAAIAAADYFNINVKDIQKGLADFRGVKCRMEKHPFYQNSQLVFDYAHHPTEIRSAIHTVKKHCQGKLFVLFQPHTYSRTRELFQDFLQCFEGADELIIYRTYPARENYEAAGDSKTLYGALQKGGYQCSFEESADCLQKLKPILTSLDVVLVLGAGDFYTTYII